MGPAAVWRQGITCQSKVAIDVDDEINMEDEMLCELALAATDVSVVASSSIITARRNKKKRRAMWVRSLFQRRSEYCAYNFLMAEPKATNAGRYQGFTRLTMKDFDELLPIMKAGISGSHRFCLCPLPRLTTGNNRPIHQSLGHWPRHFPMLILACC